MKRNRKLFLLIASLLLLLLPGCSEQKSQPGSEEKKLDFTVAKKEDFPEELTKLIEEKQERPFKLSYAAGDALYLCVGYGEQSSGGYSITVDKLTFHDDTIHFATTLVGPKKDEDIDPAHTYPYIVIKTQFMDNAILFEP